MTQRHAVVRRKIRKEGRKFIYSSINMKVSRLGEAMKLGMLGLLLDLG